MLDAICSTKTYQQINGEAVPTQVVKSRLLKVGYEHIQYVFFSLDRSTSTVKNIRQYMLTVEVIRADLSTQARYEDNQARFTISLRFDAKIEYGDQKGLYDISESDRLAIAPQPLQR